MSVRLIQPDAPTRRAILLLEVASLLHDMRKLAPGFVQSQSMGATSTYGRPEFERDYPDIPTHLAAVFLTGPAGQGVSLRDIILVPRNQNSRGALANLLHDRLGIHGKAHYEKGGSGDKQPAGATHVATAFGHESPLTLTGETAKTLAGLLKPEVLESYASGGDERLRWLTGVRALLTAGLAETQWPMNEVTLWDWGATAAVLMKPIAFSGYQTGRWAGIDFTLDETRYTSLQIRLNRLEQYTQTDRITDLLGVRQVLDDSFAAARKLLEDTCALGNRLYHDDTGDYYLAPDLDDEGRRALTSALIALFPADLAPAVIFHEPVMIGELDAEDLETKIRAVRRLVADPRRDNRVVAPDDETLGRLVAPWGEDRPVNAELCSVCHVRPVGYPRHGAADLPDWATSARAKERKVCRECLSRRGGRAINWLNGDPAGKTIWTDEVADNNGRLALFVGALGLDDWLDGDVFRHLPADRARPDEVKMPSPARLYRVAETARAFWEDVNARLVPAAAGTRPYRLEIRPDPRPDGLTHGQAYELRFDGRDLAVVWDAHNSRFLTVENLAYFHKRWKLDDGLVDEKLRDGHVTIVDPSAFLSRSAELEAAFDQPAVSRTGSYRPIIPLLAEPSVCMALVPADKAPALCREVWRKYRHEMGRVADRLPLSMGLIFFPRRTPMSAVLDAGQRLLRRVELPQAWQVAAPPATETGQDGRAFVLLALRKDGRRLVYRYPACLGDEALDDAYYPWLYTELPIGEGHHGVVRHVSGLSEGDTVFIRPGAFDFEYLDITSRRFEIAYEPLAGRRLSRPTRPFLPADLERMDRVWEHYSKLKTNQQYQALHSIESTRDAWEWPYMAGGASDETFRQFVDDTLAGAGWPSSDRWSGLSDADRKELTDAGASGELADWAEIYLEILKQR